MDHMDFLHAIRYKKINKLRNQFFDRGSQSYPVMAKLEQILKCYTSRQV